MKGRFWRKALAASLALLIVTGSVPIKPISNVFESMVVTAEAAEEYTKTYDFSTGIRSNDRSSISLTDPVDNVSKTVITLTDSINSFIIWQTNPNFAPGFISNSTGVEGTDNSVGVDTTFIISPNVDGKVTKIEFSNVARNLSYSEEGATFVSDFSLKIDGMKYNGTDDVLTGIDGQNDKCSFTFISTDEGGISGNLSLILGPNSLFKFQKGSKMIITYVPDEAPVHEHSFSFNATGNTLTATCSANDGLDCSLADSDHKATLTLNAKDGYYGDHVFHGANHNCSSFNAMTGLNATVDDIVYTNKSTGETSTSLVSAVGSYTATLVVHINGTDYTLTKDFVVRSNCEINNVYPQINISTADMPEAKYAREGEKVTLSFTSMYGESLTELTVTGVDSNNSISLTDEGNGIYSFIMPSEEVNIGATFSTISVSYLDENGETQTCNSATLLFGNETTLSEGWYVVPYDITYHNELALSGDVRLILANGTEMYIANWNGKGITADYENQGSIAIYGQAKEDEVDTGKLTINSKDTAVDLASGTYAQYGGEVRIYSRIDVNGDITINGGNIYVEGLTALHGTITLGWTNETDSIYSDGYSGNVIIVNDKVLKDEDNTPYFGTISTPSELRYKTLSPYIVHIIAISDEITGGTVSADKVANTDDIVTLTVTPNAGYVLKSLLVKDSSNNPITVTNNQFTMPDSNVEISAIFEKLSASAVSITTQPTDLDLKKGASSGNVLTVEAEAITGHTLSYQWYKNTTNSTEGGSAISGATEASYAVPTDSEGTGYYYCVVTATRTDNGETATATSNIAVVTVADYSTVIVNVTGNGTVTYNDKSVASGETIGVTAEKGTDVTLTLTPENGYAVRSIEYGYTNSNEMTMNGAKLPINGSAATLTVPNDLKDGTYVNLTVTFVSALAGGADEASAVALTDNTVTDLAGGWYKVDSDITFDHTLNLLGDTHLIIDDGKTMTVNTASGKGIDSEYTLTVSGEGALSVTTTAGYGIAVVVRNYVQTDATVSASGYIGIRCTDDFIAFNFDNDFTFSGGQLIATGTSNGIWADNNITLGYTNASDFIQSSSYNGTIKVADGKMFKNGSDEYSGTLSNNEIKGKKLIPATKTLKLPTSITGGTLIADQSENVLVGDTVTLTVTPDAGYTLKSLTVMNGETAVAVENNQFTMPAGDVTVSAVFEEIPTPKLLEANTVSFKDNLTLNFLASIDESLTDGAYVKFTYNHYGEEQVVTCPINTLDKNGDEYRFRCELTASEMAITVKADLYLKDSIEPISTWSRSIRDYCIAGLNSDQASDKEKALFRATLNYGGYTQKNFGYNAEPYAYTDYQDSMDTVTITSAVAFARPEGVINGIEYTGATVFFRNAPYIRYYFKLADGANINDYTFSISGQEITPTKKGSEYYIESAPVLAYQLDNAQNVVVTKANAEVFNFNYSIIKWAETAAEKTTNADERNMVKAMFAYYQAAKAFVESNS